MLDAPVLAGGHLAEEEEAQEIGLRANTVRVDLAKLPRSLCTHLLHDFVAKQLQVRPEQLVRMQWNRRKRCLFLKMCDEPTAIRLVGQHSGRHRFPLGLNRTRIILTLEDATTDVFLHDLSEAVEDDYVHAFLSQYGTVQSVSALVWPCHMPFPNVDNGQRLVRMVIRRPIPRLVTILGEETLVTYKGQPMPRQDPTIRAAIDRCFSFARRWLSMGL